MKKNTTKKVIKTTLAVAGIVAASVAIFEKVSNLHNKKIRQCFEKNFDDLEDELETLCESNTKPEHHEKRSHYGTITVNFDDDINDYNFNQSVTYIPEIKKYNSPNKEKNFKCICNDECIENDNSNTSNNIDDLKTTSENINPTENSTESNE